MPDAEFDLLIRNGAIIDGTGAPSFPADIAIRGDRIVAIGDDLGAARRVVDVSGLSVAPGFIDVHAHDDAAVLSTPMDFKLMQGVTTDIVGNCGAGVAPLDESRTLTIPGVQNVLGSLPEITWQTFGEYMSAVAKARPAINVGCFVPHGPVRHRHLRMERRAPDGRELAAMREDVEEGMTAGALGLSTGLIYPPGAFAATGEIIELAKGAAKHGGIYMSHIRNESERLLEAVVEAITIGREAGLPVEISHHKASDPPNFGKTVDSIALIERERDGGLDVTFDAYPYTAASTIMAIVIGQAAGRDIDGVMAASVRGRPEWEGKSLTELGEMLGVSPMEAGRRVVSEDPGAVAVFWAMDEPDVQRVMSHPQCMIGSDGIPSPTGKPHPRLYGTFPRVLGPYVRDHRLFSVEEGVRKMTSLPAQRMNLPKRGQLREGWFADIVVFDPDRIVDRATYEDPRQYPEGIDYVVVNGEVAAERGRQTALHSGRLLRRGQEV